MKEPNYKRALQFRRAFIMLVFFFLEVLAGPVVAVAGAPAAHRISLLGFELPQHFSNYRSHPFRISDGCELYHLTSPCFLLLGFVLKIHGKTWMNFLPV